MIYRRRMPHGNTLGMHNTKQYHPELTIHKCGDKVLLDLARESVQLISESKVP